jgi:GNAT superfamily N-acetyltransferase
MSNLAKEPTMPQFQILPATPRDVPVILELIRGLAEYEKLSHSCVATEKDIAEALFGEKPAAEVALGWNDAVPVAFALFFHNFSTFLGRHGLHLEDLYVRPECRGRGYGRALLIHLANIAVERGCGRFEWTVLDWNAPAIGFYEALGARILPDWRITRATGASLERMARMTPAADPSAF